TDLAYERGRASSRLSPAVEATLYRVTQEALTNALKHAEPSTVSIAIVEDDDRIEIEGRDDGRGFDPRAPADGFRLVGMRERIALVGGELHIASSRGAGTTVRASIPAQRRIADAERSAESA